VVIAQVVVNPTTIRSPPWWPLVADDKIIEMYKAINLHGECCGGLSSKIIVEIRGVTILRSTENVRFFMSKRSICKLPISRIILWIENCQHKWNNNYGKIIKPYAKYVWIMRATQPAIPATCQPIFDENMRLSEVPVDTKKQLRLKWICRFQWQRLVSWE
jgi:hypothetical protein